MNSPVIGSRISSKRFDFNRNTGEFVAEMSEVSHGGLNPTGQLYVDAADQGFVMVSEKTGKDVEFTLVRVQRDGEGDVAYWEFEPTYADVYYNPTLKNTRVVILND